MVMQTKITFYSYSIINGKIICKHHERCILIDDNTNERLLCENLIFGEYDKIVVSFESDDENATLEIDSSNSEEPLHIKAGQCDIVLTEAEEHESMLTPGYYGIRITTMSKRYEGLYFINSKSIEWNGIVNLRVYLETVMSGLSQNLYIQRMVGQKNAYGDENYGIAKMYSYIKNNIDVVINSIDSIIKRPLMDVNKEYREQHYSKKSDLKSQRWLCLKGLNKNRNIYLPDIVYEKKAFLNKDIYENYYIKYLMKRIIDLIISIEDSYQIIYTDLSEKVKEKTKQYSSGMFTLNMARNDKVVSDKYKINKRRELSYLEDDINKSKERLNFIEEISMNLEKVKIILVQYLNETWLYEVSDNNRKLKMSAKILKDNRYYQIYNFYLNLHSIGQNNPQIRKPYFPSKSSPKLFEYYAIVLTINIIVNSGYIWEKGWLADNIDHEVFNGEIPTNIPFVFMSKDYSHRIEVIYEKVVQSNLTIIQSNISDFIRMNAVHYKPDIMISVFDNTTEELVKTIVIEVKCCKSSNLQSKNGPSKAIEQVKNYYNFGYYNKDKTEKKATRGIVDKIIIIYPKQKNNIEYEYDDMDLSFIQVEANESNDITKHYGYDNLKKELLSCLEIS